MLLPLLFGDDDGDLMVVARAVGAKAGFEMFRYLEPINALVAR